MTKHRYASFGQVSSRQNQDEPPDGSPKEQQPIRSRPWCSLRNLDPPSKPLIDDSRSRWRRPSAMTHSLIRSFFYLLFLQLQIAQTGWNLSSNETLTDVQNAFQCCGFDANSTNHPECPVRASLSTAAISRNLRPVSTPCACFNPADCLCVCVRVCVLADKEKSEFEPARPTNITNWRFGADVALVIAITDAVSDRIALPCCATEDPDEDLQHSITSFFK